MVWLNFTEPQQYQEEYYFIFIRFSQTYASVTSVSSKYGPNCQDLGNQTTIIGFNLNALSVCVSIIDKICFVVTINNTFHSYTIQGNYSNEASTSPGKLSARSIVVPLI